MRIYISGPITGTDDYMERFEKAEEHLKNKGFSVVNPAKINSNMPSDTTYDEYMEISKLLLSMCDAIYMLEGWHMSTGAKLERSLARLHNIIEFYEGSDENGINNERSN